MSLREWTWVGVAVLCLAGWLARPLPYEPLVSVVFGAVIGAVVSWYFSERASNELRIEAEKLRDTTEHAIRMLQTISGGGRAQAIPDEQGKTKGVAHSLTVSNQLDTTDSVKANTRSAEDGDP
jgi:gas vesicle protein